MTSKERKLWTYVNDDGAVMLECETERTYEWDKHAAHRPGWQLISEVILWLKEKSPADLEFRRGQ